MKRARHRVPSRDSSGVPESPAVQSVALAARQGFGGPNAATSVWFLLSLAMLLAFLRAQPALAVGVVGTGTSGSCTETVLDEALAGGGMVTFNCGASPVTITVTRTKTISADTTIDGGSLITISGGNSVGVFSVNTGVNFVVQNLTIANGASQNALVNNGTLTVTGSTFSGNSASGIWNSGTATVIDSTFSGNSGTAIDGRGQLVVANSTFSSNPDGAISALSAWIANCTFADNGSVGRPNGGAIIVWRSLAVTGSTFSGNRAQNGGGIFVGAIDAAATVTNCTFSGNGADRGGAIDNAGSLTISNSSFSGNSATTTGGAVAREYVCFEGCALSVVNSTFSGNSAPAIDSEGSFATTLTNTIVAGSAQGVNCAGTITDGGHNLDDGTSCGFSVANGSLSNTDPKLDPAGLADHGGLTQTIALREGSRAIDAGDPVTCANPPVNGVDQRGYVRPGTDSTNCSIGAYEYRASAGAPVGCVGDCDGSGKVTVAELVRLVNIALDITDVTDCGAGDASGDGEITVDELVRALSTALGGCEDAGPGPLAPEVTIDTYPAVDGSTSTLPLARLIACELLGLPYQWQQGRGSEGEAEIVPSARTAEEAELGVRLLQRIVFNKTHQAYLNLVDGVADLITVANPPSPEERAYADQHGVTLVWEPLALDALVIVLNAANPVRGLTTDQVQRIYMGELTDWSEVGGEALGIYPYVRPENSGSQQLFNTIVMQGRPMPSWPPDHQASMMGGLIDMIRTYPQAIGYSVYYWVTYQYPKSGYSVISVDGVAPTAATIGKRTYPFAAEVWLVTRSDLAEGSLARQLHDWMLSPYGQRAVSRSGYVPIQ